MWYASTLLDGTCPNFEDGDLESFVLNLSNLLCDFSCS